MLKTGKLIIFHDTYKAKLLSNEKIENCSNRCLLFTKLTVRDNDKRKSFKKAPENIEIYLWKKFVEIKNRLNDYEKP